MNLIVAVDKNWAIGKDNNLLYSIKQDMQFFRQTTLNKIVVMGSNTLRSFPNEQPLKNRTNIVMSSKFNTIENAIVCHNLDELKHELNKCNSNDIFVIGGEIIYNLLLPYCETAYITKIDAEEPATKHFPNLDENKNWEQVEESETFEENGINFRFTKYKNNNIMKM